MFSIAFALFIAALFFAPLAFGTVEIWAYTIMEILICLSAALYFGALRTRPVYQTPGLVPLLLLLGVILVQILPLPPGLVRLLSPHSYALYHQSAGVLGDINWMTISVAPRSTLMELLRFSTYTLFYVLTIQMFTQARIMKRSLHLVSGFAVVLAVFVLLEFAVRIMNYPLPQDKIMWIRDSVYGAGSVGPYVNRNHYAGLMEMLFPLTLGLFLIYRPVMQGLGLKERLAEAFAEYRISPLFLYATAAMLLGASLFVTLSRGGIISLTLSLGLLALFLILKTGQKRVGVFIVVIFVGILCLTGSRAWDLIFERFGQIRTETGEIHTNRFTYWKDSLGIIEDFPLLGTGMGSFETIYPLYRTHPGTSRLEHAHSDYLEFVTTGGLLIPAVMAAFLAVIGYKTMRNVRSRKDRYAVYICISSLAGVAAILFHSFVDFNLQVGANGLYFFFLLALALSAASTRFHPGLGTTYLQPSRVRAALPLAASILLGMGVLYVNFGALLGNYHFAAYNQVPRIQDLDSRELPELQQAARSAADKDPFQPKYVYVLARIAETEGDADAALYYYQRLLKLGPVDSEYLQATGRFLAGQNRLEAADRLMQTGIACSLHLQRPFFEYASFAFAHLEKSKGLQALKTLMDKNPKSAEASLALMAWYGIRGEQMQKALPDRVWPHLEYAEYLLAKGDVPGAEKAYLEALSYVPREEKIKKSYFLHVYRFYRRMDEKEKALHILQQAAKYLPHDRQVLSLIKRVAQEVK
ncbi:MAG: O-antigen ligase family protein [Desulfovermiculus sp.]